MVIGQLGSFFRGIGGSGLMVFGAGIATDAVIHGVAMKAIAKYLATKSGKTVEEEMNKADLLVSGIAAIPIGAFGTWRMTKGDYESDVLDFIGLMMGGAMGYEIGSTVEVVGSLLKLGEL